jgi:hypothetical protein
MLLILELIAVTAFTCLSQRAIPLYLSQNDKRQRYVSVRIGEEICVVLYGCFVTWYLCTTTIDFDFFINGSLDKNVDANYTEQSKSLEPFLIWNMWYFAMSLLIMNWPPSKEGDTLEYALHHVSTVCLMLPAFADSWILVSAWVVLINGILDIFMSLSRIAYKLEHWTQTPLFGIALIIHITLRVVYFPYRILKTAVVSDHVDTHPLLNHLILLILPLWFLFIYWMIRMCHICYLRLFKGVQKVDYSDGDQPHSLEHAKKIN